MAEAVDTREKKGTVPPVLTILAIPFLPIRENPSKEQLWPIGFVIQTVGRKHTCRMISKERV